MHEFIRNLISNPLFAFIAFLVIWGILVLIMIKWKEFEPRTWASFEYIWVGIGFIAVLTLIAENKAMFQKNELSQLEVWIEQEYRSIVGFLDLSAHCVQFQNTGIFEQTEFDRRQHRQDTICQWTHTVKNKVDSLKTAGYHKINSLPTLDIDSVETEWVYTQINQDVHRVNGYIDHRENLKEKLSRNSWDDFRRSFGVIFLILAFSLRYTIVTYKVNREKEIKNDNT